MSGYNQMPEGLTYLVDDGTLTREEYQRRVYRALDCYKQQSGGLDSAEFIRLRTDEVQERLTEREEG